MQQYVEQTLKLVSFNKEGEAVMTFFKDRSTKATVLVRRSYTPGSIEWLTEEQAFLRSYGIYSLIPPWLYVCLNLEVHFSVHCWRELQHLHRGGAIFKYFALSSVLLQDRDSIIWDKLGLCGL